ncbi:MAG: glycosyltransferase family 4 protein [Bellilinea sp.]|nr:glycosyltransferase family 4 protein [Bellilinea sp.]
MKVGLVIYGDLNTLSGGYLYDRKLVEYLRSQGDEVEVISLPWRDYLRHSTDNFSLALKTRLRRLRADILLQDELNHPSLFLLNRQLKKVVDFPLVSIVHHLRCKEEHPPLLRWFYRQIEGFYLNSVDGFICNSQTTLQTVREFVKNQKPTLVATPGGDGLKALPHEKDVAHSQSSSVRLIFVGNWIPRKGLHILLEALQGLLSFDWRLYVVGRTSMLPSYEQKIRRMIESGGLSQRVEITGAVSDEELVKLWQTADVLVVPSQFEGFGIVYLEAMRFGVLPIGGLNGAAHEIIQSGINGFLVPPNSTIELREILRAILTNPELMNTLKKAARDRYEQFPNWQSSMASVRQFLVTQFLH